MKTIAISFWKWIRSAVGGDSRLEELCCKEMMDAAQEYRVRELAFWSCVNLIANAVARCDFRTFVSGKEVREREFYLWNVEPNVNQNSTVFLHKLVARLYQDNEALIVNARRRRVDGEETDNLVVADSWQVPAPKVTRQNEYKGVQVGELTFNKSFREEDAIHLTLNHCNIKPVIDGLFESYLKLIRAAMDNYEWTNGQHWKVTVNQMVSGGENWPETFQKILEKQIRPFLNSGSAVLPELNGYKYENMSKFTEGQRDSSHIRALVTDIFDFTANAFLVPPVLLRGQVEGTADAWKRFLTNCVDPLADQMGEEITRKRYGYDGWRRGSMLRVDTSAIEHFNLFDNAASVEKLIGSGYSYNDVQRAAGGQEIDEPWANKHFLTKNFALAEELLKGGDSKDGTNPESGDGDQADD